MDHVNASRISNFLRFLPLLAALAGALGSVERMDLEPPHRTFSPW